MKISIQGQIDAVQLELINIKGHIDILHDRLRTKKADPIMVEMQERKIPALEAAVKSLIWLRDNREKIIGNMNSGHEK